VAECVNDALVKEDVVGGYQVTMFDTPEKFAASLKEEQADWGVFIRQHNIVQE
jgi:hypothetical protein